MTIWVGLVYDCVMNTTTDDKNDSGLIVADLVFVDRRKQVASVRVAGEADVRGVNLWEVKPFRRYSDDFAAWRFVPAGKGPFGE